jgi:hypothetical protein
VVDRFGQVTEEPFARSWAGGIEGGAAQRAEFARGVLQALGIAAGEDDVGALGAGSPGCLEPDSGAAAGHDDCLAEQLGLALDGNDSRCGGHDSSGGWPAVSA